MDEHFEDKVPSPRARSTAATCHDKHMEIAFSENSIHAMASAVAKNPHRKRLKHFIEIILSQLTQNSRAGWIDGIRNANQGKNSCTSSLAERNWPKGHSDPLESAALTPITHSAKALATAFGEGRLETAFATAAARSPVTA
jgi:hypothetical protein